MVLTEDIRCPRQWRREFHREKFRRQKFLRRKCRRISKSRSFVNYRRQKLYLIDSNQQCSRNDIILIIQFLIFEMRS